MAKTAKKCLWENCPILYLIDRIGIESFSNGIKKTKKESMNLLTDSASMILFVMEERPIDDDFSEENESLASDTKRMQES